MSKRFALALALSSAALCARSSFAADAKAKAPESGAKAETSDNKATDKPAGDKPAAASSVKLTKPWSDLATLTDDQKAKIDAIHKKQLAETGAIDKKAKEDIMAVLTDAQKAELKELTSKKKKETTAKKTTEAPAEKKAEEKKTEKSDAK